MGSNYYILKWFIWFFFNEALFMIRNFKLWENRANATHRSHCHAGNDVQCCFETKIGTRDTNSKKSASLYYYYDRDFHQELWCRYLFFDTITLPFEVLNSTICHDFNIEAFATIHDRWIISILFSSKKLFRLHESEQIYLAHINFNKL